MSTPLHASHLGGNENFTPRLLAQGSKRTRSNKKRDYDAVSGKSAGIRLADLCQEDKVRIGELIKRLAYEKSQREVIEAMYEKEQIEKDKQIQDILRQNQRIKAQAEDFKEKYERTVKALEDYKSLSRNSNVYNEVCADSYVRSRENERISSFNARSGSSLAIRQKDVCSVSVQTVCDKEMQTLEEKVKEEPSSQLKSANDDLFSLSESIRTMNISSLRGSQNHVIRSNEARESNQDSLRREKIVNSSKLSQDSMMDSPIALRNREKNIRVSKNDFAPRQVRIKGRSSAVEASLYDENLFRLVDDLEQGEVGYSGTFKGVEESLEKSSESILFMSKKDSSIDSLEELMSRAVKLKQKVKYI